MIRPMTTISWTSWLPRPMMSGRERSRREKDKLSICDLIEPGGRDCSSALLVQGEERPIVAHVLGIEDRHRAVVQNQPALLIANGHDRMTYLVFVVLHDDK